MVLALIALGIALGFTTRIPFIILLSACALCNLLPIFMFKHRMLQMRLLLFAAIALLGLQAWMAYDYFTAGIQVKFNYSMVVPVIAAILDFLAVKGVVSDELLVRSAGRLRTKKK